MTVEEFTATLSNDAPPSGLTPGVFSISLRPMTSASSPTSAWSSLSRCRLNSSGWLESAPRQSRFALPPHGPGPLSLAVVSRVRISQR